VGTQRVRPEEGENSPASCSESKGSPEDKPKKERDRQPYSLAAKKVVEKVVGKERPPSVNECSWLKSESDKACIKGKKKQSFFGEDAGKIARLRQSWFILRE